MSWRYPKWRELDGYPVDIDAINEDAEATVEEMEGALNEHNWAFNAIVSLDDVGAGVSVQMASRSQEVDPGLAQGSGPPALIVADAFRISTNMDWVVIDPLTATVVTDTSNLWIMASFQQEPSDSVSPTVRFGVQYGIRIDGVLLWECVIGGGDRANDTRGEGYGGNGQNLPVVLDALLPVVAGSHTVEIVARTPRSEAFETPAVDDYWMILNRELIVMEMY